MIAIVSRTFLSVLATIFTGLAFYILMFPGPALAPHGLNFDGQPNSALAEIRAFYFGTMGLVAFQCLRGAYWNSSTWERRNSLLLAFTLLWLFVIARVYAYFVDGPPELAHAYSTWTAEIVGAGVALVLYSLEETSPVKNMKKK